MRDFQTLLWGAINGVIAVWVIFFVGIGIVVLLSKLGAFGVFVVTVGWGVVILGPIVWLVVSAVRRLIGS